MQPRALCGLVQRVGEGCRGSSLRPAASTTAVGRASPGRAGASGGPAVLTRQAEAASRSGGSNLLQLGGMSRWPGGNFLQPGGAPRQGAGAPRQVCWAPLQHGVTPRRHGGATR